MVVVATIVVVVDIGTSVQVLVLVVLACLHCNKVDCISTNESDELHD